MRPAPIVCTQLSAALALFLSGCVTSQTYHPNTPSSPTNSVKTKEAIQEPFDLAFVEFGEEGSYRDESQIQRARELIDRRTREARKTGQAGPLVVIFIHGWHHTANPKDRDILRFQNALRLLAKANLHPNIVGVYLGWHGEQLAQPPVINSLLTYYSRKSAAERLANNLHCYKAIETCVAAAHRGGVPPIVAGHSFGGLVLERAIKSSMGTATQSEESVNLRDSLFVMLNPATESVLSRQIMQEFAAPLRYDDRTGTIVTHEGHKPFARGNEPMAVSITSTNDKATGWLFPTASWIWQALHVTRGWQKVSVPGDEEGVREGTFIRRTPGHSPQLHNFTVADGREIPKPANAESAALVNMQRTYGPREMDFLTSAKKQGQKDVPTEETAREGPWKHWTINYEKNARVPYWIIQVPPEIVNDHGGIWSDNSVAMIGAIYRMKFLPGAAVAPSQVSFGTTTRAKKGSPRARPEPREGAPRVQDLRPPESYLQRQMSL